MLALAPPPRAGLTPGVETCSLSRGASLRALACRLPPPSLRLFPPSRDHPASVLATRRPGSGAVPGLIPARPASVVHPARWHGCVCSPSCSLQVPSHSCLHPGYCLVLSGLFLVYIRCLVRSLGAAWRSGRTERFALGPWSPRGAASWSPPAGPAPLLPPGRPALPPVALLLPGVPRALSVRFALTAASFVN